MNFLSTAPLLIDRFAKKRELLLLTILLLREGVRILLIALATLLSFESILPGTVSLRNISVFFVASIASLLFGEQILSKKLPASLTKKERITLSGRMKFFLTSFFLWAAFLFGNALIGFHPWIVAILMVTVPPLIWLFFSAVFGFDRSSSV